MKKKANGIKKSVVRAASKSLMTIADIFSILPCDGPWYEVKVPKKLQK